MLKWRICILLFLATTLNYLDRQTLSILAPALQEEMSLSNADLGLLFSGFYYTYTLSQFGVGLLLDRTNLRWVYGGAVLAWSLVAALTSLSTGLMGLLFFRLLLGVAESANWPAAMRIVARTLPPQERALGNGIFTSGTSIGALIAPALILWIAQAYGWRAAFIVVGALGLLWWIAWIALTGDKRLQPVWQDASLSDPRPSEPRPQGSGHSTLSPYSAILRAQTFWSVFVIAVTVNPCLYFNLNWLPTYLNQQRGIDPQSQIGILTAIFLGLDLGYLASGSAALILTKFGWSIGAARRAVFTAATALVGFSAAVPFVTDLRSAIAVLVVVNFGVGVWIAMYLTFAQEVSPDNVSTAAGLLGGSGSLAGAFAMWAVGLITQQTRSFALPLYAVSIAAVIALAAGLRTVQLQARTAYDREEKKLHVHT